MYKLQVTADKLNIRNSPDADPLFANWVGDISKGEEFIAVDMVKGEEYNGISYWYRDNYNRYVSITGVGTNDPNVQWSLAVLGIPHLWNKTKGEGIKIAVIDSGTDLRNADLSIAAPISSRYNVFDGSTNVQDNYFHGTYCSSIIGSRGNNGLLGVAPQSELMIIKIADSAEDYTDANILAGIKKALAFKPDIISMSFGSMEPNDEIRSLINSAMLSGIICIAATGNMQEDNIRYPANYKGVISVGNVLCINHSTPIGEAVFAISNDSNSGISDSNHEGVTIVAPGEGVSSYSPITGKIVNDISGSSFAVPFVAGVAGLWLSLIKKQQQNINYHQGFRNFIITNATKNYSGYNSYSWGAGVINPFALLSF